MKLVITGATGFIGSHLIQALHQDGHQLFVVVRPNSSSQKLSTLLGREGLICYDGTLDSLTHPLARIRPEVVIHLASLFIAEHQAADVTPLIQSNILFPTHLLEAMDHCQCRALINTGTVWQHYHNQTYNPVCLYAATKQAFEDICLFYALARSMKTIHLQLTDSYGPQDPRRKLIAVLKAATKSGASLAMSPGDQPLDLVHVYDIVEAYRLALKRITQDSQLMQPVETYCLSSGQPLTLKSLVKKIEQLTQTTLNTQWGARPYRSREVMELWQGGSKLPGWQPKISLDQGLRELFHD